MNLDEANSQFDVKNDEIMKTQFFKHYYVAKTIIDILFREISSRRVERCTSHIASSRTSGSHLDFSDFKAILGSKKYEKLRKLGFSNYFQSHIIKDFSSDRSRRDASNGACRISRAT